MNLKTVMNPTVAKATAGAFLAGMVEPYVQDMVTKNSTSQWAPVLVDVGLGVIAVLPSIEGMSALQYAAAGVLLANALVKAIKLVGGGAAGTSASAYVAPRASATGGAV